MATQLPRRGRLRRGSFRGPARRLRRACAGAVSTATVSDSWLRRLCPGAPTGRNDARMSSVPESNPFVAWLMARSDGQLCAIVATLFWLYTVANKMLVRGTLLAVKQVPFLATPEVYALQYLIMVPALIFVHWSAFKVGLPRARLARALVLQLALVLGLAIFARFALDVADTALYYRGDMNLFEILEVGVRPVFHAPLIALSTGLDIIFQYSIALALIAGVLAWKRYQTEAAARAAFALEAERARRMALRRQLDPHSLFNTLNAVAAAIRTAPNTAIA